MKLRNLWGITLALAFLWGTSLQAQTKAEWRQDLRFLQETIHEDFSFLFKKTTAKTFDYEVEALYQQIPELTDHEILAGFLRLIGSFEYGHTQLGYWESEVALHQVPILLYDFKDGVFIQGAQPELSGWVGAEVTEIEGMPIEEAKQKILPLVPAENSQYFRAYGMHYLTYPEFLHAQGIMKTYKNKVEFTLSKEGKTLKHTFNTVAATRFPTAYGHVKSGSGWVDARDTTKTPLYLKKLDKIYTFEHLPKANAVYVRHSQIQDDPLEDTPAFYDRVFEFIQTNKVDKLILDVRLNGGGNNYKNKAVIRKIIQHQRIDQSGKLIVIIGRRTFSACQNLVNELSNYTNAVFIGEPTAENINFYGDNRPVTLPKTGMKAYLSFAWWQDKPQWENDEWLAPHIPVEMTFQQYIDNEDPALEVALAFNDENFVMDPMGYFTELFTTGQIEKLKSESARMMADPDYSFFDFEMEFDQAGYSLMDAKRYEEALFVFQMNAQSFPDSPRVWDSLAEGFYRAGDTQKAEEYYKKAIKMDPKGHIGVHAQKMLDKMRGE